MQAFCKKEKLGPLRNEASLNFVSLRSHFDSVRRRGLSRVEMNALRAPLTALYVSAEMEIFFSLDTADAFIDGRHFRTNSKLRKKLECNDESHLKPTDLHSGMPSNRAHTRRRW